METFVGGCIFVFAMVLWATGVWMRLSQVLMGGVFLAEMREASHRSKEGPG